MLTRKEFRTYWNNIKPGWGDDASPVWAYEQYVNKKCRWFVNVQPFERDRKEFWRWCMEHCRGQILCYSSDPENQVEWWGFSHQADVAHWLLKWS